ncbi:uncharacterized protein FOMMEDRAFT_24737 [Fomitiporia mediterranea MF3/22]|uniref:uncharacterized protein n=1 Tax=Fomitiporia mediterranea (strain MF3/22) TaxID=694068 RepID=UPI0004408366|nr:uncharacterized protein FOMMEDRAFT_24737 [Fomitiporia mediterranea MF3/22]EJD07330.1 hypothetical protein FOMMEDRAFT_24737 [Fomitiporia mediterranea MF3/22]
MSTVYPQVHGAADPVAASNAKYRSELEDYGWFVRPADTENESSAGYYGGYPCESSAGAILAAKLAGDLDGILTLMDEDFEFGPSVDGLGRDTSDPAYLDSLLPDGTPTYMARRDEAVQSSVNREAGYSIDVPHTQGETLNGPSFTVANTTPRKDKGRKICSPRVNNSSSTSRKAPRPQASPFDAARGSSTPELSSSCSSPPSSELSTPASSPVPVPVYLAARPSTRTSPRKRKATTKGDYMDADEFDPTPDQASSSVPQKRGRSGPKRFMCKWKELFGGACTSTSTTAQAHDRHIVTHLPEDSGHAFEGYLCSICMKGCNRQDSCQRHINTCCKGAGHIITVDREWFLAQPANHHLFVL